MLVKNQTNPRLRRELIISINNLLPEAGIRQGFPRRLTARLRTRAVQALLRLRIGLAQCWA
jgi:hypothetical protein